MAISQTQLESLYLAYFGRPADFDGLVFYTSNPAYDIWSVAAAFSASPESQALYGSGFSAATINAIYQNLFNRDAEPAGLLYWSTEVASGRLTAAGAAYAIYLGAQNADKVTVANKMAASAAFTTALDTAPEIIGYAGQDAAALARAQLHTVTSDPATLTAYIANINAEVAAVVAVGGVIGSDFTLSANVDTIVISDATTINTVHGVIDGANSTYSVGDSIDGNGKTIVELAVAATGTADLATLKDVKAVNVIAGTNGSVTLDALLWDNVGSVNITGGMDGMDLFVNGLNAGADLTIAANVGAELSASFTNNVFVWEEADSAGSIAYVDGNVAGVAGAAGYASFSMDAEAAGTALTVGNITISNAAGDASDMYVGIFNTEDQGADVTVGNVSITGADQIWFTVSNDDHTTSSNAVNTTIGNVTVSVNASGTLENFDIYQTSTGEVGNLTVGNVSLTMGKSAVADVTWEGITIENTGYGAVGNLTLGNVALNLAKNATVDFYAENYAYSTSGAATAGNLAIGTINVTMGQGADLDFTYTNEAYVSAGSSDATVGTTAIGTMAVTLGQSASMTGYMYATAYNGGSGDAIVGSVNIGTVTFAGGLDSVLELQTTISASATGGGDGIVGDVIFGDANLTLGIGAYMSYTNNVYAYGGTGSAIGNVTIGNANIAGDDGSTLDYLMYDLSSDGTIGDVSIGNLVMTGGVSASLSAYYTAMADGTIGNVTIGNSAATGGVNSDLTVEYNVTGDGGVGNVTVGKMTAVGAQNADVYMSVSISATSGSIGDVTIGNFSASASKLGNVSVDHWIHASDSIGDVTVGTVNVSAIGATAVAEAELYVYGIGGSTTIGAVTVGDVTMAVKGTNAYGSFSVTAGSSAASADTLTVGNMDLSIGESAAKKTGATLYAYANNYAGDLVIGNITVHGTSTRGTTDTTQTYTAEVYGYASGTVKVGNITVTGGDGAADNLNNLGFLNLAGAGTETIGNVDYSAYGAKATIDVSMYKGAAAIIGGAKADTITDNSGTNAITGGASADKFIFVDANAGHLTAATADSITDFSNSGGDKIDVTLAAALNPDTNYGENSFADFTSFISGANSANKEVFVGQVGSDSFVAVDLLNDGSVDYLIKLVGVGLSGVDVLSFV